MTHPYLDLVVAAIRHALPDAAPFWRIRHVGDAGLTVTHGRGGQTLIAPITRLAEDWPALVPGVRGRATGGGAGLRVTKSRFRPGRVRGSDS